MVDEVSVDVGVIVSLDSEVSEVTSSDVCDDSVVSDSEALSVVEITDDEEWVSEGSDVDRVEVVSLEKELSTSDVTN